MMNIRKIIKEELLTEQLVCHLISPTGRKNTYISNEEAFNLIDRIVRSANMNKTVLKNERTVQQFNKTIQQFRSDIKGIETNNDTVDTYLHKLRTLLSCFNLEN